MCVHWGCMRYPQFCHCYTERDTDDGPSYPRRTVIGSIPKSLTPHFPFLLSVLQRTYVTDRRLHEGSSCTTVLVVRDLVSKGLSFFFPSVPQRTHVMDHRLHDGPSCTIVMLDRDPVSKGLSFFSQVFPNGHM